MVLLQPTVFCGPLFLKISPDSIALKNSSLFDPVIGEINIADPFLAALLVKLQFMMLSDSAFSSTDTAVLLCGFIAMYIPPPLILLSPL